MATFGAKSTGSNYCIKLAEITIDLLASGSEPEFVMNSFTLE